MEAMRTRFLPPVAQIRRLVADGTLGEIVSVNADHGAWFPEDAGSRLFAPELGGGALLDLGVLCGVVRLDGPGSARADRRPQRSGVHRR